MTLYTAQYRYPGEDRLDITVKGNHIAGRIYAPTWGMVMQYKRDNNMLVYTNKYYTLLQTRWIENYLDFRCTTQRLVDMVVGGVNDLPPRDLTLVCFCPANTFCHRYLLKDWLICNWPQVQYGGERHV